MKCHRHYAEIIMVETSYGGLMACGMLLDVARIVCDKSWVSNKNCYPFESSWYQLIRNICELDEYSTHFILSKFCNHAHILVDSYKCNQDIGGCTEVI